MTDEVREKKEQYVRPYLPKGFKCPTSLKVLFATMNMDAKGMRQLMAAHYKYHSDHVSMLKRKWVDVTGSK